MSAISYEGQTFPIGDNETVLDVLLKQGVNVNHGCRAGICQSCVMVCEEGDVPLVAQKGLKQAQKELNHFMACQCSPESVISVSSIDGVGSREPARVIEKSWLNDSVMLLRLETDLTFKAGQYVTLWRDESLGRCYSIASVPEDGCIECHIKIINTGQFSRWVRDDLQVGKTIGIQGPLGSCIYQGALDQKLLLCAIGTGLAPIYGILKDALQKSHSGQIDVVIGAREVKSFYLLEELKSLEQDKPNLKLHFISQSSPIDGGHIGDIYEYVHDTFTSLADTQVYLCGAESFVKKMRRQCFMDGASMTDIHADSFVAYGGA